MPRKFSISKQVKSWLLRKLCTWRSTTNAPVMAASVLHTILVARYDRIGDMIVTTPLLRALRQKFPHAHIAVLASASNACVLAGNPYVNQVHVLSGSWFEKLTLLMQLRQQRIDCLVELHHDFIWHALWMARVIRPRAVATCPKNPRYGLNMQNVNLFQWVGALDIHRPISELYMGIAQTMGYQRQTGDLKYDLYNSSNELTWAKSQILGSPTIGINLFGSRPERHISAEDCKKWCLAILSQHPHMHIVLLNTYGTYEAMLRLKDEIGHPHVSVHQPSPNLMEAVALVRHFSLLITPETSFVHIACALDVPLVAIFKQDPPAYQHWQPLHPSGRFRVIFSEGNLSEGRYNQVALLEAANSLL